MVNWNEFKKNLDQIAGESKKILEEAKGEVQRQIETREGVFGKAADLGETAANKAKEIHKSVQEKGGYGAVVSQTAVKISETAKKTYKKVQDELNKIYPTSEELKNDFANIGTKYDKTLTRERIEDCIKFYNTTEKQIPQDIDLKEEILTDIKKSASTNKIELMVFYNREGDSYAEKKKDFCEENLRMW
ncbi:MAG: hypothetical protein ABIC91_02030 [Nanoarchaeota archaeon]